MVCPRFSNTWNVLFWAITLIVCFPKNFMYELGFDVVVSDSPDFRLCERLDTEVFSGTLLVESFVSSSTDGTFRFNLTSGSLPPPSSSVYSSSNECLSS